MPKTPTGRVAVWGLASAAVCVLWAGLTGAVWQVLPVALAMAMAILAAKAVYSDTRPKDTRRRKK